MPLNLATLAKAHEVKWLVGRERDIQAAEAFVSKVRSDQAFCLQPISASPKATRLCVEALMQHPTWYLSLQTHKMVRIA
jgi:organic radical activating enzyme